MKKSNAIIIGVVAAAVVGIGAIASMDRPSMDHQNTSGNTNSSSTSMQQTAKPNEVLITDFKFGPDKITVKKGTTVTWTNKDEAQHDITPTGGGSDFERSKLLAQNESYNFTFNEVGKYEYKCSPHPYMKGAIEVTE